MRRSRSRCSGSSSGRSLTRAALVLASLNTVTQQTTATGLSATRTHHIGTVRSCVSSRVHRLIGLSGRFNTGILTLRELFNPLWFHTYLLFVRFVTSHTQYNVNTLAFVFCTVFVRTLRSSISRLSRSL